MRLVFPAFAVVATLALSGVGTPADAGQKAFSGSSIFEGVFLRAGAACRKIETECSTPTGPARVSIALLERNVQSVDPGFFSEFAHKMTSGDPGLVSAALRRGARDVLRVATASRVRSFDPAAGEVAEFVVTKVQQLDDPTISIIVVQGQEVLVPPRARSRASSAKSGVLATVGPFDERTVARITSALGS
jgi:hypothetical protein